MAYLGNARAPPYEDELFYAIFMIETEFSGGYIGSWIWLYKVDWRTSYWHYRDTEEI